MGKKKVFIQKLRMRIEVLKILKYNFCIKLKWNLEFHWNKKKTLKRASFQAE